ncbi:MAG: HAMP domain-containing histidine kinase [Deltaproteobacteria bacterium]|nr:HAMP domain-containing histidine kinase [Deltaproteobacteria bacterium]
MMSINSILKNTVFRTGIEDKSSIRPLFLSVTISLGYIIIVSVYIWLSGVYAGVIASSLENLKHIELIKGLLFALVTGVALFATLFMILLKIKKKDEMIIAQNKSIISSEGFIISGIFASSVSHDINNLLTVILGNSEILANKDHFNPAEKKYIDEILTATLNLSKLAQKMMEAGKGYIPDHKEFVDLPALIEDTINFAKIHNKIKFCNLHHDMPHELEMTLNPLLFSRTLMNLILNSAEATGNSGEILVKLKEQNGTVILEVHDNGPGISEEIKENIFNPLFTTKKDGNGLGLLSLKIFEDQHKGAIDIKGSDLGGACISISFPKNQSP